MTRRQPGGKRGDWPSHRISDFSLGRVPRSFANKVLLTTARFSHCGGVRCALSFSAGTARHDTGEITAEKNKSGSRVTLTHFLRGRQPNVELFIRDAVIHRAVSPKASFPPYALPAVSATLFLPSGSCSFLPAPPNRLVFLVAPSGSTANRARWLAGSAAKITTTNCHQQQVAVGAPAFTPSFAKPFLPLSLPLFVTQHLQQVETS